MIQTIMQYKKEHKLTWLQLANRFSAETYQEAQGWHKSNMLIATHLGKEKLISVRRERSISRRILSNQSNG